MLAIVPHQADASDLFESMSQALDDLPAAIGTAVVDQDNLIFF
jgi:hypothetical protein